MKKLVLILMGMFFFSLPVAAQQANESVPKQDTENLKMLTSQQEEEVKVEIRKPDDSSVMPRKSTNFQELKRQRILKRIKESNKMFYKK